MLPPDYLNPEFWRPKPRSPKGDELENALYLAVGMALSRWERLEITMATLFGFLVERRTEAAERVYGRLGGTKHRLDALREAADAFFGYRRGGEDIKSAFSDLLKVVSHANQVRTNIAHGFVAEISTAGAYLVPPSYQSTKIKSFVEWKEVEKDWFAQFGHAYAYTSTIINDYGQNFVVIDSVAQDMVRRLLTRYPLR